jgi:hypothetical protein
VRNRFLSTCCTFLTRYPPTLPEPASSLAGHAPADYVRHLPCRVICTPHTSLPPLERTLFFFDPDLTLGSLSPPLPALCYETGSALLCRHSGVRRRRLRGVRGCGMWSPIFKSNELRWEPGILLGRRDRGVCGWGKSVGPGAKQGGRYAHRTGGKGVCVSLGQAGEEHQGKDC